MLYVTFFTKISFIRPDSLQANLLKTNRDVIIWGPMFREYSINIVL